MNCRICKNNTGSLRPYCSKHIDELPYIRLLSQYNDSRAREAKISDRIINLNGILAAEILEYLKDRPREKEAICNEVDISPATADRYIPALAKVGYVAQDWARIDGNGGRHFMVRLTDEGKQHLEGLTRLV